MCACMRTTTHAHIIKKKDIQTSVTIGDMVGIEVKVSLEGFTGVRSSRELATGVAAVCCLGVSTTCRTIH